VYKGHVRITALEDALTHVKVAEEHVPVTVLVAVKLVALDALTHVKVAEEHVPVTVLVAVKLVALESVRILVKDAVVLVAVAVLVAVKLVALESVRILVKDAVVLVAVAVLVAVEANVEEDVIVDALTLVLEDAKETVKVPPEVIVELKKGEYKMKTYKISVSQEVNNYLQRLNYEIETHLMIINKIFEMHKNDVDVTLFDSEIWKKYQQELVETKIELDTAKDNLSSELIKRVQEIEKREDVNFDWSIDNYLIPEVRIIVKEDK